MFETFAKALLLNFHAGIEITYIHSRFNALNNHFWSETLFHFPGSCFASGFEDFFISSVLFDYAGLVPDPSYFAPVCNDLVCKINCAVNDVAFDNRIHDSKLFRLGTWDRITSDHEIHCFSSTY